MKKLLKLGILFASRTCGQRFYRLKFLKSIAPSPGCRAAGHLRSTG